MALVFSVSIVFCVYVCVFEVLVLLICVFCVWLLVFESMDVVVLRDVLDVVKCVE